MKQVALVLIMSFTFFCYGQDAEEAAVRSAVDNFFLGFHKKDGNILKSAVAENVVMQTIARNKEGETVVKTESYENFVKSILAIPADADFEERLLNYTVQIDANMAHVWAPYGFWYNKEFSHCGVNSIQLVKIDGNWKITYMIDTRRKENCILE